MAMSRGEAQYNSILAMKLKLQMDQQAQEKAEALQREQLAEQKLQGYLNTMNQAGQLYYQSARARDQEERERAAAEIKYMREVEKEMRDRQQHNMDQLQDWNELLTQEKGKGARQEDRQLEARTEEDRAFELGRKIKPFTHKQRLEQLAAGASRYGLTPPQKDTAKKRRLDLWKINIDNHESILKAEEAFIKSIQGDRLKLKRYPKYNKPGMLEKRLGEIKRLKSDLATFYDRAARYMGKRYSLDRLDREINKIRKDMETWKGMGAQAYFPTGGVAAPGATPGATPTPDAGAGTNEALQEYLDSLKTR